MTSSIRSSSVGVTAVPSRSEMPQPRRSKRITRANCDNRRRNAAYDGSSQTTSMLEASPHAHTRSTGPSPIAW